LDYLALIEVRIARWLAYADHCVRAEVDFPICRGFWTSVTIALGASVLAVLAYVLMAYLRSRRDSPPR